MIGQMKNYSEYMSQEYEPISLYSVPYAYDMRGLKAYADSMGIAVTEVSEEDKEKFIVKRSGTLAIG